MTVIDDVRRRVSVAQRGGGTGSTPPLNPPQQYMQVTIHHEKTVSTDVHVLLVIHIRED